MVTEDDREDADWEKAMLAHVDDEQVLSQKLSQLSASDPAENKPQLKRKRVGLASDTPLVAPSKEDIDDPVPDYLSQCTKSFVRMIHQAFSTTAAVEAIDFEELRQAAIWMDRIQRMSIQASLWHVYLQSGTGQLSNVDSSSIAQVQLWPSDVKIGVPTGIEHGSDHDACLDFVHARLRQWEEKGHECRERLDEIKQNMPSYTLLIDQAMQTFVQRNLQSFRTECERKKTMAECDYQEKLLECQFNQWNPTERQVIPSRYYSTSHCMTFSFLIHLVTTSGSSPERQAPARRGDE